MEFNLLAVLSVRPGEIFSADELIEKVFAEKAQKSKVRLARMIGKIRSKLAASSENHVIQTIQHKGYRLKQEDGRDG